MPDQVTLIAGLLIPSAAPVFLGVVGVRVLAGLTCVVAGAVARLSRKGAGRHPMFGRLYVRELWVVFVTAVGLGIARWAQDYPLVALAGGVDRGGDDRAGGDPPRRGAVAHHRDWRILNSALDRLLRRQRANLPVGRYPPRIALWPAPSLVGAPILTWAFLRHPWARRQ
jgi:hypothetical protein